MKCKRLFLSVLSVMILLAMSLCVASAAGQDAPYRLNDKQVESVMRQLKKDAEKFRKSLDSELDKSRLDGTNREDDINAMLKDYEKATERLYDRFKDKKSVSADVEGVLDSAAQIDRFMARQRPGPKTEREWAAVREDLRQLANAYNVTWRWW
jgi:hypothetical protein